MVIYLYMKRKKTSDAKEGAKKRYIFVVLTAVVVLLLVVAGVAYYAANNEFRYEGWIDCMPPLDPSEAELCERAKRAGYPNIAY